MKSFLFNLITLSIAFFSMSQSAVAQWTGTNPVILQNITAKVGIGTNAPTQKLQIVGGNILLDNTNVPATTGSIFFGGLTYPDLKEGMRVSYFNGTHNGYMDVRTTTPTEGIIFRVDQTAPAAPGTERMRICANGNVGIGAAPGTYRLYVSGNAYVSGSFLAASDRRFKKDVQTLGGALATVTRLRGVRYEYRQSEFADRNFPSGKTDGFIAQELREVLPELVTEGTDGYLAVNYQGVIPVLVEAVKELKAQKDSEIAALKQELSEKSQQIYAFEARMAKLEARFGDVSNPSPQTTEAVSSKTSLPSDQPDAAGTPKLTAQDKQ